MIKNIKRLIVLVTIIGLLLPFIINFLINYSMNPKMIDGFNKTMIFFFHGQLFVQILFWIVYYSIPFLFLGILTIIRLKKYGEHNVIILYETIFAYLALIGSNIFINISIMTSKQSTAAIGYIFIPLWEICFIFLGLFIGWLIIKLYTLLKA